MLPIKTKFLLIVKAMYFGNPFGVTLIFALNLLISCMIKWLSQSFELWNIAEIF